MRFSSLAGRGSGIEVRVLGEDARALSREEFEDRHASAFLLLAAAELALPKGPGSTEVRLLDDAGGRGESTASLALIAYPLRRGEHSAGHLITLGRASNNDVVIPDVSVSRFHAFVKEAAEGAGKVWRIQDAGSTNGTTLNGRSVPRQGHGAALAMGPGDNVRLGQVELTFLDCDALLAFAAKLER